MVDVQQIRGIIEWTDSKEAEAYLERLTDASIITQKERVDIVFGSGAVKCNKAFCNSPELPTSPISFYPIKLREWVQKYHLDCRDYTLEDIPKPSIRKD